MSHNALYKTKSERFIRWSLVISIWATVFTIPYFSLVTVLLSYSVITNTTLAMIICAPWSWFLHRSVRMNKLTAFVLGEPFDEATFKKYRSR
jgi:hypothetical protein